MMIYCDGGHMKSPVLLTLLLLAPAAWSEEWSRFRGPNGSGVSSATGFPAELGKDKNLAWRTPVRTGKSSPVLTDRHIFLTAFDQNKLFTICLDRATGKLLWERSEDRPRNEVKNRLNDSAAITPVTDGENVYVFFGEYGLISYDTAGKLRWKTPLGPFTNVMGVASSPILTSDYVIVVADQQEHPYIAAFDRRNGEQRWKTPRDEQDGWGTPILYGSQILTASRGQLGAHAATNGKRIWSLNTLSPAIVASPVLGRDTLFTFGYGNEAPAPFSGRLQKLDTNGDGKLSPQEIGDDAYLIGIGRFEGNRDGIIEKEEFDEKQRKTTAPSILMAVRLDPAAAPRELWRYEKNFVGVIPSPLLYEGVIYIVRNGGILTSFDASNGAVIKAARVPGALGGYSASPVAAEGKVYLASEEGNVAILKAGGEWDVISVSDLGEGVYATPALSDGTVYLRTSDAMYAFAKRK